MNDYMRISSYDSSTLNIEYFERNFFTVSVNGARVYRPATSEKRESINTHEIIFNIDNYYVAHNSAVDGYEVYYKYGTSTDSSLNLKAGEEGWRLIEFGYFNVDSDAIQRAVEMHSDANICIYTDAEGISKCDDTKAYNNLNDIIMKELAKKDIYVRSYKNIAAIDFYETNIINDDRDVMFRIRGMILGTPLSEGKYSSFNMNGEKYYTDYQGLRDYYGSYGGIYLPTDGSDTDVTSFSIDIADNTKKSKDEIIKEFAKLFGAKK
jgi:hypothetical protein